MINQPPCFLRRPHAKLCLILLLVLGFPGMSSWDLLATHSELHWRWSNPLPHGGNIFDIATHSNLTIQVAERGQIFTSEDFVSWEPRESRTTRSLRGVTFFHDRIIISGESGLILYADSLQNFEQVDLETYDWLEDVAASDRRLVAVGDNGAIYISEDGIKWTRRPVPFSTWLRGVTYGEGIFVAVGEEGLIITSPDGMEWTRRPSNVPENLNRVKWIENQFWITGEAGRVLTSPAGGTTWTRVGTAAVGHLFDPAGGPDTRLVVGDHEARLRGTSGNWMDQIQSAQPLTPPAWAYFNANWQGSFYFMTGETGMMVEGFQTNAASPYLWVNRVRSVRNWLWEIKRLSNFYITVGARGTIMTSFDGISWDVELPPDSAMDKVLLGVGGTTNQLLAVGEKGTILVSTNMISDVFLTNSVGTISTNKVSHLGVQWEAMQTVACTQSLQGITFWKDDFYVCGEGGTILRGSNGQEWEALDSKTTNYLSGLTSFPGGLVAVGSNATLLRSKEGNDWSKLEVGSYHWIFRVRYVNDTLVAVGKNGLILTSKDGDSWTRRDGGTSRWLNDVIAIADIYYIVGNQGTVLASKDLETWTNMQVATLNSLFGIAHDRGRLVVAGTEGAILRADFTPSTHPIRIQEYDRIDNQNLFLLQGHPGQRFTLDASTNLNNWSTGPTFEFLDNSGTIIILTPPNTSPLGQEFYQAPLTK